MAALEGGWRGMCVGSGLGAINAAILAFVGAGDHVLVTDSVYGPARRFCDTFLGRFGVVHRRRWHVFGWLEALRWPENDLGVHGRFVAHHVVLGLNDARNLLDPNRRVFEDEVVAKPRGTAFERVTSVAHARTPLLLLDL